MKQVQIVDSRYRSFLNVLDNIMEQITHLDKSRLDCLLKQLANDTVTHFHREEKCMSIVGFSNNLNGHCAEHQFISTYTTHIAKHSYNLNLEENIRNLKRFWLQHMEFFDAVLLKDLEVLNQ